MKGEGRGARQGRASSEPTSSWMLTLARAVFSKPRPSGSSRRRVAAAEHHASHREALTPALAETLWHAASRKAASRKASSPHEMAAWKVMSTQGWPSMGHERRGEGDEAGQLCVTAPIMHLYLVSGCFP